MRCFAAAVVVGVLLAIPAFSEGQPLTSVLAPGQNVTGWANGPIQLYTDPPTRSVLFPFFVREPEEAVTIKEGTPLRVLGNQEVENFFEEPERWIHVETPGGQSGWIDVKEPIEWLPLVADFENPNFLFNLHATVAWLRYVQENSDNPDVVRSALEAMPALKDTLEALEAEPVSEDRQDP